MNRVIPLLLTALTLGALAHTEAAHADEWRLGEGYRIFHRDHHDRDWRRVPGSATDVGDGWVIGTDRRNGGYGIYRWDGRSWHRMPGAGVEIGGSYDSPWVINDRGERFSWTGYGWREEANFGRRNDRRGGYAPRDNERRDNDWNRGRRNNDWNNGRRGNERDERGRRNRDGARDWNGNGDR